MIELTSRRACHAMTAPETDTVETAIAYTANLPAICQAGAFTDRLLTSVAPLFGEIVSQPLSIASMDAYFRDLTSYARILLEQTVRQAELKDNVA